MHLCVCVCVCVYEFVFLRVCGENGEEMNHLFSIEKDFNSLKMLIMLLFITNPAVFCAKVTVV